MADMNDFIQFLQGGEPDPEKVAQMKMEHDSEVSAWYSMLDRLSFDEMHLLIAAFNACAQSTQAAAYYAGNLSAIDAKRHLQEGLEELTREEHPHETDRLEREMDKEDNFICKMCHKKVELRKDGRLRSHQNSIGDHCYGTGTLDYYEV